MSKRRGNSEGTIAKRADGRWEARVSLPNGTRKSFYGKTREDVQKKLRKAQRDIESGLSLGDGRQTVEQYLTSWLESAKHRLKVTSHYRYTVQIRHNILPGIGKIPLIKLTAQHLQSLYTQKYTDGLAPATIRQLHSILHNAFADAVRLGLVSRSVVEAVRPPRKPRKEMKALDEQQAARFIEVAKSYHPHGALYILAITTGMRLGEVSGLRWQDVDFEKGLLQVEQTVVSMAGKLSLVEPKSSTSRRPVRLVRVALDALAKHHSEQIVLKEKLKQLGQDWNKDDLVFINQVGKPLDPVDLGIVRFHAFLRDAGLPRIRFHDLRHTAATLMLKNGINVKVVSEMLGHASITITLGIYGHVLPDMQQTAVEKMNDVFGN
jgi:integrase